MSVRPSVSVLHFCLSPGGQTFLTHKRMGGQTFLHTRGRRDKQFSDMGGTNILTPRGEQTFSVGGDDVDGEEEDVSEANMLRAKRASSPQELEF